MADKRKRSKSKSDKKKKAASSKPPLSRIRIQSPSRSRSRSRSCSRSRTRKETPSSIRKTTGADLETVLWGKLLRPLPLMYCQKYEVACSAFKKSIYSGQGRFVWNKKFQDHLLNAHKRTFFAEQANTFLAYFSAKIGRYCRQLILKVYNFPPNNEPILKNFTKLTSMYLKVEANSLIWERFISVTSTHYLTPEFRVVTDPQCITERPAVSFAIALAQNEDKLRSLQLWRLEERHFRQGLAIFKLPNLTKYRLYLENDDTLHFFKRFTNAHGHRLTSLYLKWEHPAISGQSLSSFGESLSQCKALELLSLTLHWNRLVFVRNSPKNPEFDFRMQLDTFCKTALPASLESLSLDVSNSNFQTQLPNADLIGHLVVGRHLKSLRIIASLKDVFPLKLPLASLQSLELSLHYNKMNRQFGHMIGPYQLLPYLTDTQRFEEDPSKLVSFLFASQTRLPSVKSLKLCLFPLFDTFLAEHLALVFPRLEMLSFSGYHERAYHKGKEAYYNWNNPKGGKVRITFQGGFERLLERLPSLRVLRLADKFTTKPELTFLVNEFYIRAAENRETMYALFIDFKVNCVIEKKKVYTDALELKNLRIY